MLKCCRCESILKENDILLKYDKDTGYYSECPECGYDDFEDVIQCEECGEWFESYMLEEDMCDNCRERTVKKFRELLLNNFTQKEIMFLERCECSFI